MRVLIFLTASFVLGGSNGHAFVAIENPLIIENFLWQASGRSEPLTVLDAALANSKGPTSVLD